MLCRYEYDENKSRARVRRQGHQQQLTNLPRADHLTFQKWRTNRSSCQITTRWSSHPQLTAGISIPTPHVNPPPTPVLATQSSLLILCLVAKLCRIHCDIVNMYLDSLLWAHQHWKRHGAHVHVAPASPHSFHFIAIRKYFAFGEDKQSYIWIVSIDLFRSKFFAKKSWQLFL